MPSFSAVNVSCSGNVTGYSFDTLDLKKPQWYLASKTHMMCDCVTAYTSISNTL